MREAGNDRDERRLSEGCALEPHAKATVVLNDVRERATLRT
jgi:hypothetical protein